MSTKTLSSILGHGENRVIVASLIVIAAGAALPLFFVSSYPYIVAYLVIQQITIGAAWRLQYANTGYFNFGNAAFVGLGEYVAAYLYITFHLGIAEGMVAGGIVGALLGFGLGLTTLRLHQWYFAVVTLSVATTISVFVLNTPALGRAIGLSLFPLPKPHPYQNIYELLFVIAVATAVAALFLTRAIERSQLGRQLQAVRGDELTAEAMGVATLRLKLLIASMSGFLMSFAGATYPFYTAYIEPNSSFSVSITTNSITMPLVGGLGSWIGPLLGGGVLGIAQQAAAVTISSVLNVLLPAAFLLFFAVAAPQGLVGLIRRLRRR